jgi:hypothetical protein
MAYQIELLRQGPPPKSTKRFVESDMCVPVLPNTARHPLDRPSLQPTTPLPWPDCYHSSFDTAVVRVATRRAPVTEAVELPPEEMRRQIYYQVIDQARMLELRKAHHTHSDLVEGAQSHQTNLSEERHVLNSDQAIPAEDTPAASSNVHNAPAEVEPDSDAVNENIQNLVAMIDENRPSPTMPVALMTYDLSTVETVSDPRDFFEERRVLRQ